MSDQNALPSGYQLNHFTTQHVLGTGGFAITYLAKDNDLNTVVAIKEYFPRIAYRDTTNNSVIPVNSHTASEFNIGLKRFQQEAQTLARFKHHNIVRVLSVFEKNGTAYMVMDYEEGETLQSYLNRLGRAMTYDEILSVFMPVMDGIREMHKQSILHLDIKPDNIFMRASSTPCLIDFGGARYHAEQESRIVNKGSRVSFMVATDGYSSPEQYTDKKIQGTWCDIYSTGASIYQCISLKAPPKSTDRADSIINTGSDSLNLSSLKQQFPPHFIEAIENSLSLQRNTRPASISEFQTAISPVNKPVIEDLEKKPNYAIIALAILAIGVFGLILLLGKKPDQPAVVNLYSQPSSTEVNTDDRTTESIRAPTKESPETPQPKQITQENTEEKRLNTKQNCISNNNIHKAAAKGDFDFVNKCLESGVEVDIQEGNNWTPLHSAARNGHLAIVKLLLRKGANINAPDKYRHTPLDQAIAGKQNETASFLKKQGGKKR